MTAAAAAACALWGLPAFAATKHPTTTHVSVSPKTAYVGARVKLSATVTSSGKAPTGTVTFTWQSKKLCTGRLSKGSAHCYAKFSSARGYTVKGTYSGNSTHKTSWGTAHLTVKAVPATAFATTTDITAPNPIATQASGLPYTIKVVVTSTGGGTPTGTVAVAPINLKNPGPTYSCTATLGTGGKGSCVVTPPKGAWGFTLFQATYSGDATHKPSASSLAHDHKLINPSTTTTTVGPASSTSPVTLKATVTDQGNDNILAGFSETGGDTVSFAADGTTVPGCGAVPLTWNGSANIATCADSLPTGSHSVKASYSGDEYTFPSSGTETLTVTP